MLAKKIVAFMFPFIVACAIGYYLEHGLEDLLRPDNTGPFLSFADYSGLYQLIMAKEAKSRHLHGTVIVEIDPLYDQRELSLHTLCEQRLFLSSLLSKLAKADVIVIDKWLSPSFCLQDNKGTQSLVETVNKVCKDTPIVIGLLREDDKILQPSLKFDCGHKLMGRL